VEAQWFVLSAVLVLAVVYALARRNEARLIRDWRVLLSPRSQQVFSSVQGRLEAELTLAELTYEHASAAHHRGGREEAQRILEVVRDAITSLAPKILRLLAAMSAFSRMVSGMVPVAPLRPRRFRLAPIASLAYLDPLVRRFLVTGAERFRLHLYVLGRCVNLAVRFLLDAARRIARNEPAAERNWKTVADAMADLRTLTDGSLESLRALLQSLDRQTAEETIARLEQSSTNEREPLDWLAIGILLELTLLAILVALSVFALIG
jgi:hypothetical protein